MKKSLLVLFLIIVISFTSANFAFSQSQPKELEIKYPAVPGAVPITSKTPLPDYVKYIFNFAIWIGGFIALGVLIYGGFRYFTSIGNPEKIRDAKEWIIGAISGLLILFASYLVLSTISPYLTTLPQPEAVPLIAKLGEGVMVCQKQVAAATAWALQKQYESLPIDDIKGKRAIKNSFDPLMKEILENCYHVDNEDNIREDFDNKINYAYFISEEETYGAIFYEEKGFEGNYDIIFKGMEAKGQVVEANIRASASSVRLFKWGKPEQGHQAILYEDIEFNFGLGTSEGKQMLVLPAWLHYNEVSFTPQSIEIKGDDFFVILYKEWNNRESEIFWEPGDRDLNNNERIHQHVKCPWYEIEYSCTKSAVQGFLVIPGKIY